ncbi:hypothetical protein Emag_003937 [Eimeria magna]
MQHLPAAGTQVQQDVRLGASPCSDFSWSLSLFPPDFELGWTGSNGETAAQEPLRGERGAGVAAANDNNPFGDRLLAEPFVWKKKNLLLQAAGKKHATTVSALLSTSVSKVMIEEMLADVKLHIGVDTTVVDKDYQDFWQALLVLTKDALERAERKAKVLEGLKKDSSAGAAAQAASLLANNTTSGDIRDVDSGIAVGVAADISAILGGKTPEELEALKEHIKSKLETEEDVDSAYWEAILQKIPLFKARAICLMYHERIVKKAAELDYQMRCELAEADASAVKSAAEEGGLTDHLLATEDEARQQEKIKELQEQAKRMARVVEKEINPGADGSYSPELEPYEDEAEAPEPRGPFSPLLYPFDEFRSETNIMHPDEEAEARQAQRRTANHRQRERRLIQLGIHNDKSTEQQDDEEILDPAAKIVTFEDFVRKEQKNANPDEEVMADSSEMKLKQGYKFNIFYPDLIDKTKTPTWTLEPSDTPDTIIVRFHAGPPYEDVAFKILNREWHLERFRGFRNVFDRGIMQLYFSFKKYCYRR